MLAWGMLQALGLVVCNLYRAVLTKRLKRKGLAAYMANPWIRAVMVVVTFEYIAFAMAVQFSDWGWSWTASHWRLLSTYEVPAMNPEDGGETAPPRPGGLQFAARVGWIALRVILVLCIGQKGSVFLYQNF